MERSQCQSIQEELLAWIIPAPTPTQEGGMGGGERKGDREADLVRVSQAVVNAWVYVTLRSLPVVRSSPWSSTDFIAQPSVVMGFFSQAVTIQIV